jgi:HD-like signal output (HDOD) protein
VSLTDPYVKKAATLPAMPEVACQLMDTFGREDLSLGELSGLIGRDQALAARVLRYANSAHAAPRREVDNLHDAAALLGLRALRELTLSVSVMGAFPKLEGFDRLAFWRGTLAVASYAQAIAPRLDVDPAVAYLGGLMLRTGQILMAMVDPAGAAEVSRHALAPDSRIDFESGILGCAHPEITAELARHWRFPTVLITAFGAAVDPLGSRPFSRLGAVLRLASVIADHRDLDADPPKACARPRRPWSPTWTWIRRTWPPDCPTTGWPWPAPTR